MIHQLPTDKQCFPLLVVWLTASLVVHHQPVILPLLLVNHSSLQLPHRLVLAAVLLEWCRKLLLFLRLWLQPVAQGYKGRNLVKAPGQLKLQFLQKQNLSHHWIVRVYQLHLHSQVEILLQSWREQNLKMTKLLEVHLVVIGESQYHHHQLVGGAVNGHDTTHSSMANCITIIIYKTLD